MKHLYIFIYLILVCLGLNARAVDLSRPDGHAPIGVMGDHTHKEGELMLSLRVMSMEMEGLIEGTDDISTDELFASTTYMMAPSKMTMWMTMLGGMYALTDQITIMAMIPYLSNTMDMKRKMQGDTIGMDSVGIGDVSVSALYSLSHTSEQTIVASLGLGLPTGSTKEEMSNGMRMAYPMQLGSGSTSLKPGIVFNYFMGTTSFGAQANMTYFLGKNSEDYQLGNKYLLNLWSAYQWSETLSSSLRLSHQIKDPLDGADSNMNAMMSPILDARLQHGHWTTLLLGLNFIGQGVIEGHRLAVEVGSPIAQDLKGPQMKKGLEFTFGWQKGFH